LEALKVLNLEAPPEKRMEPKVKQEGSKPSEKKIEVTTPEIKEDTTKEVKMENQQNFKDGKGSEEEEKTKASWFPYTSKQEEAKGFSPSMEGRGYEPVQFIRDDVFGDVEKGRHPGFDNLQIREIGNFLRDKFEAASEAGHLPKTYKHYVGELKKTGALDDKVILAFEKFIPEVEKGTTVKKQKVLFQEIAEYLGQLKMERRV
jgi:hypothetical protein